MNEEKGEREEEKGIEQCFGREWPGHSLKATGFCFRAKPTMDTCDPD